MFYNKLPKFIENENNTILAGDFNMIEYLLLDKLGGNTSSIHLLDLNRIIEIKKETQFGRHMEENKSIQKIVYVS